MIVFLDKDGVYETPRMYLAGLKYDPVAVNVLNKLFARPGVFVVISATFRKLCRTKAEVYGKLAAAGIHCNLHQDWSTGGHKPTRAEEIQNWLQRNPGHDFIVIDDEPCGDIDPSKWMRCDSTNGMSSEVIQKILNV